MSDTTGGAATATTDNATADTTGGGDAAAQAAAAAAASAATSSTEYDLLSAEEQAGLSDPGKKALQTERAARRDAERQLTANAEALKAFEDRDKGELQLAQEGKATAESERDEWKGKYLKLKVSADKGLPAELADLLQGDDEDKLAAHADTLLKHLKPAGGGGGGGGDNGHDQGPRGGAAPPSMNDLIRDRLTKA